ncbi:MAG: CPBP family intramembrane metalloprotease [bacterium]|jgi:membrane protease YdiL (CAAX protease family)
MPEALGAVFGTVPGVAFAFAFFLLLAAKPLKRWERGSALPGFGFGALSFAAGIAAGAALVVATIAIAIAAGDAGFSARPVNDIPGGRGIEMEWARFLSFLLFAAVREELMIRAYLLLVPFWCACAAIETMAGKASARARGALAAAAFCALLAGQAIVFALMHADNPNATSFALVNVALAGALFGIAAAGKGGFYAAAGMHWAINLTYEVFNLPISGIEFDTGFHSFAIVLSEGGAAGGGAFGLEGGWAMTAALILGIAVAVGWLRKQTKSVFSAGAAGSGSAAPRE